MKKIFNYFRRIQWKLTFSYAFVTASTACRAKTSSSRKRGKKGGKSTTLDPKNGSRKR